jgi:FMN phosphatase YigB (HAD superfamily)
MSNLLNYNVSYKNLRKEKLEELVEEYSVYVQEQKPLSIQDYFEKHFEYDEETDIVTDSYKQYEKYILNNFDLPAWLNLLERIVDKEDLSDLEEAAEEVLDKIYKDLQVEEHCPHCNSRLFLSDLSQYDKVCFACDENF